MSAPIPIETWPARLEEVMKKRCAHFQRAFVLRETDSTQDAARRLNAIHGDVVTAWRQTAGRGRFGRSWSDVVGESVTVSFVIDAIRWTPPVLSMVAAVGTAKAVEQIAGKRVGIKWPNDVLIERRKIAGILIEASGSVAIVGIGLNVLQTTWPEELAQKAISLRQIEAHIDRLEVLETLVCEVDRALGMSAENLLHEFRTRDALRGNAATFKCNEETVQGIVNEVDPMRGVSVRTAGGDLWLYAATTTVLSLD